MRIVWLGNREEGAFRETACAIARDPRIDELIDLPHDASAEATTSALAPADGVVLAVHHFEPRTSAWFSRLNETFDASRWRAALGPFAAVAARAPFDVLHRQGFLTSAGPFAIRRWLDRLSGQKAPLANAPLPKRALIWEPTGDRSGIDPAIFASRSPAGTIEATLVTPRRFGLPFSPDVTIAWITDDLNREERVHLGQLRSATPRSRWVAVYASPSAAKRFSIKADATLVWPYDVGDLLSAAAGCAKAASSSISGDRAA